MTNLVLSLNKHIQLHHNRVTPLIAKLTGRAHPQRFWHVAHPVTEEEPWYSEGVYSSTSLAVFQYGGDSKLESPPHATICLLHRSTVSRRSGGSLPIISSINLGQYPDPEDVWNTEINIAIPYASGADLLNFCLNPNHLFSTQQRAILTGALQNYFPLPNPHDKTLQSAIARLASPATEEDNDPDATFPSFADNVPR